MPIVGGSCAVGEDIHAHSFLHVILYVCVWHHVGLLNAIWCMHEPQSATGISGLLAEDT